MCTPPEQPALASTLDTASGLCNGVLSVTTPPPAPDQILFLQSSQIAGAKTWSQGDPPQCSDYSSGAGPFEVIRHQITSLADLAELLQRVPFSAYHIRGETVQPGAQVIPWRRTKAKTRLDGNVEQPSLRAAPHRFFAVDVDAKDGPVMSDLPAAALEARGALPWPLSTAECFAMATSGAGLKPGPRLRLWFVADRLVTDQELKALLSHIPWIDTHIFSPHQPIYCAAPRFEHLPDPFPGQRRFAHLAGEVLQLPEDLKPPVPEAHAPAPDATRTLLASALQGISGRVASGARNTTLMSIAGSMRSRGLGEKAILAALIEHNAAEFDPPLPPDEVARTAASAATYEPSAIFTKPAPPSAPAASKALREQAQRVAEDPALLLPAMALLRRHVDSGALTETQVANRLGKALGTSGQLVSAPELIDTLRRVAPAPETAVAHWQTDLLLSADGTIRQGPENMGIILERCPDLGFWHDSRADETQLERAPWSNAPRGLLDSDGIALRRWFDREMSWPKLPMDPFDSMRAIGMRRPWDPWKDGYLSALVHDGQPRLIQCARALLGNEQEHAAHFFRWWMISAVARTFAPGCQADHTVILSGEQGVGKSSFLQELVGAPRYYSRIATTGNLRDVRVTGQLQGPVVIEIAELASISKRDVDQTKEFLDCREDKWQPLYSRTMRVSPRRVVFAGTTNTSDYLQDTTGGRRFWPVEVSEVDLATLREHRDQIWAEAVALYRAGERWYPSKEESARLGIAEVQEEHRAEEQGEASFATALQVKRVPGAAMFGLPPVEPWMLGSDGTLIAAPSGWLLQLLQLKPVQLGKALRPHGWVPRFKGSGKLHGTSRIWYDYRRFKP